MIATIYVRNGGGSGYGWAKTITNTQGIISPNFVCVPGASFVWTIHGSTYRHPRYGLIPVASSYMLELNDQKTTIFYIAYRYVFSCARSFCLPILVGTAATPYGCWG